MAQAQASRDAAGLVTVRTVAALREVVGAWRRAGETVAAVPTMGALHEGHLALVRRAKAEADRTVATLFVNPRQFNQQSDLASYPRNETRDAALFAKLGVDLLFAPDVAEIYPPGFATTVSVGGLTDCLCGKMRPGHMDGVATVVCKLFTQIQPDVALFGEKDYQQLLVVTRMARDLDLAVRIVPVATVRDADGLALSSRNEALSPAERAIAPLLHRVLSSIAARAAGGQHDVTDDLARGVETLTQAGFTKVDYLEMRDAEGLAALARADRPARVFGAAWLGPTRLIDNVPVG